MPSLMTLTFFFCYSVYFCLHSPLNCISFNKFSQLSIYSLFSSGLISLPYWSFQIVRCMKRRLYRKLYRKLCLLDKFFATEVQNCVLFTCVGIQSYNALTEVEWLMFPTYVRWCFEHSQPLRIDIRTIFPIQAITLMLVFYRIPVNGNALLEQTYTLPASVISAFSTKTRRAKERGNEFLTKTKLWEHIFWKRRNKCLLNLYSVSVYSKL